MVINLNGIPITRIRDHIGLSGFGSSKGGRSHADESRECRKNCKQPGHSSLENFLFHSFVLLLGMKKAPYFYDAHFGILNCDLCVSHIDEITVCPDTFIPDPDIGYILVFRISAHAGIDVSFKINAIGLALIGLSQQSTAELSNVSPLLTATPCA
jgi:hypothetical protein